MKKDCALFPSYIISQIWVLLQAHSNVMKESKRLHNIAIHYTNRQ